MNAFLYHAMLQWKLDFRNKDIVVTYYLVPLLFFFFMGNIFTSIIPDAHKTLIQSMTVFGVTMGAMIGTPHPLVEIYASDIKKSYRVGGIPLWVATVSNYISAFIHLMMMSMVIYLTAPLVFQAELPQNTLLYFGFLSLFISASLCIGTLLGLFIKNASKLTMFSQLVFLPSVMLSGIMFPSDMLPKAMQYIGMIFPASWGYELLVTEKINLQIVVLLFITILTSMAIAIAKIKSLKHSH
ncbi:ABC transporter permease [Irregularibacter muris]|uniref:ABC transporter permease n=1 Tax=Irregularibacter muris TaxID=1796619 RepID=A0AAE3L068_9FIRM|nr:ABC transporter permease [Irregularibacter muris]MCR1899821.1 ABC transporter permease [Irregularibacter muris]